MSTQLQPIREYPSFAKDPKTRAILNIDEKGLHAYKRRKNVTAELKASTEQLETRVDELEDLVRTMVAEMKAFTASSTTCKV